MRAKDLVLIVVKQLAKRGVYKDVLINVREAAEVVALAIAPILVVGIVLALVLALVEVQIISCSKFIRYECVLYAII